MNKDILQKLKATSDKLFCKGSFKIETTKDDKGNYKTEATIRGIPEIVEAFGDNEEDSIDIAIRVLNNLLEKHLEKDLFPTKSLDEYNPITLDIQDLMDIGGLLNNFLTEYTDKHNDNPIILTRYDGTQYECVVEANEGNIHSRRSAKNRISAIEKAVRLALSIMYPIKIQAKEDPVSID